MSAVAFAASDLAQAVAAVQTAAVSVAVLALVAQHSASAVHTQPHTAASPTPG